MLRRMISTALLGTSLLVLAGCGNSTELDQLKSENSSLQKEVTQLKADKKNLEEKIAMYVPSELKGKPITDLPDQPMKVGNFSIGPDDIGITRTRIELINVTSKTIDAAEFVILKFDNFGRPANSQGDGNVTSPLTLQGEAAPNGVLSGAWTLYLADRATKGKIILKQVHFTDGSVWRNSQFQDQLDKEKGSYN